MESEPHVVMNDDGNDNVMNADVTMVQENPTVLAFNSTLLEQRLEINLLDTLWVVFAKVTVLSTATRTSPIVMVFGMGT